jgi:signal transduction histidine kinase
MRPRVPTPKALLLERLLRRSRLLPLLVILFTLLVLAALIAITTRQVRQRIRDQITGRDAEVLHAVVVTQLDDGAEASPAGSAADPGDQLTAVLVTSRLKGVLGTRLFDAEGAFVASFPPLVREADLSPDDLSLLRQLRAVSRFIEEADPNALFYPGEQEGRAAGAGPLLVVSVPLHTTAAPRLQGIAQFLIEGHTLARELAQLDRHLAYQAIAAFLAGGLLLVASLNWAFRRLRGTQRLLAERTVDLQRANEDLARAARTAAVGAVTAHLIHGLKSPLAGLQSFVAALGNGEGDLASAEWQTAVASTRRMQSLISQVVNVLREEETSRRYELSVHDVLETVQQRVGSLVEETGVRLAVGSSTDAHVLNHTANLVSLILTNLVDNALRATPPGKEVCLQVAAGPTGLTFEVRDQGPGFGEGLTADVFAPRRSTREGGAGIGLAISKQLANHLGATLELRANGASGCVFALGLPPVASVQQGRAESAALG